MTYKESFIKFMVDCGVLTFGEFTLKSGRKAPYFINCGNYKTGAQLAKLGEYYAECINANNIPVDTLFGPAYKGIPLAASAAAALACGKRHISGKSPTSSNRNKAYSTTCFINSPCRYKTKFDLHLQKKYVK